MASTQPVPARQDSSFTDDIEKKDNSSSNEKLGYVDTVGYDDDDASGVLRLKQAEELEVCHSLLLHQDFRSSFPRLVWQLERLTTASTSSRMRMTLPSRC